MKISSSTSMLLASLSQYQSQYHLLRRLLNPNKQPISVFTQQRLKWPWQFRPNPGLGISAPHKYITLHMGMLLMRGARSSSSKLRHHRAINLLSLCKFWLRRIWSPDTVVVYLVAANVAVFILWKNADTSFMAKHFMISWDNLTSGRLHTLITCAFSHYEPRHLTNNMLGLYFFGQSIANIYGAKFLLKMYLGGAFSGSIFYLVHQAFVDYNQGNREWSSSRASALFATSAGIAKAEICNLTDPVVLCFMISFDLTKVPNTSTGPHIVHIPSKGASAAVNAIILLNVFLFPTSVVYYDFFIPIPAAILGAINIGTDLWIVYQGDSKISGAAHLGGAFVGILVCARIRRWI